VENVQRPTAQRSSKRLRPLRAASVVTSIGCGSPRRYQFEHGAGHVEHGEHAGRQRDRQPGLQQRSIVAPSTPCAGRSRRRRAGQVLESLAGTAVAATRTPIPGQPVAERLAPRPGRKLAATADLSAAVPGSVTYG
jgi:hypothetical protein